jgi:hypothetical protein
MTALAVALLASGCGGTSDGDVDAAGGASQEASPAADGLTCAPDVRSSAIYDYGEEPNPDAEDPQSAVEVFFGDGLPDGATLDGDGTEVTVMDGDAAVATIGLLEVPGGYVVASYDACEGIISGP